MTNPFCLLPKHADDLMEKIKSGELSAESLAKMTSEARRAEFAKIVGDANAEKVNASFESRLLLKNQQAAIKSWIEKAKDITPAAKRELLTRVQRMDPKLLEPANRDAFLSDLAKQRLGFGVTSEEAGKITALAKEVSDARQAGDFDAMSEAQGRFSLYTGELKGREPMSIPRGISTFVRAAVLTWPTVLIKLTAAALGRAVTTPIEDLVATGVSKGLPSLAEGAPRYGTSDLSTAAKAEAAGQVAQWTRGIADAGQVLLNRPSKLDLMKAGGAPVVPHAWYEYSGAIHSALKTPARWGEYARALYRRTAQAAARGEDTNDLTVKMRLSTEALGDADRAILMQDNVVAKAWNSGLARLEAIDKTTGKPNPLGDWFAAALRSEVPIVKVPVNLVTEASNYIGGLLTGSARAAWAYAHGIEDLKPVQRDAIIRQIAKGSVGAAIMALYFFKQDQVQLGGFYEKGEKRKANEPGPLGIRINGVDIPKQLGDVPVLQAAQFAATIGHVYGTRAQKGDDPEGLIGATTAAAFGLLDEVPIIGQVPKDVVGLLDRTTRGETFDNMVAGRAIPGAVQWIARHTDDTDQTRKPKGMKQHLEANIPGLRKNVPLKKKTR